MSNVINIQLDSTYNESVNYDTDGNVLPSEEPSYDLTNEEELCFTCPLKDCKENSVKCPINIARAGAK